MQSIKWRSHLNLKHFVIVVLLTGLVTICLSMLPTLGQTVFQTHSLWCNSAKPISNAPDSDTNGVELGVKFTTRVSGDIIAIRFYRFVPIDSGYTAHLWSNTGDLLGSGITIEGQGPTPGWQTVQLPRPVPVVAGQTYIASYFASKGLYAADAFFFNNGVDNGPLSALRNTDENPNSVYVYTTSGGIFPTQSHNATNYWVDVVLKTPVAQ